MHFKSNLEQRVSEALKATGVFTSGFFCIKEQQWTKLFPETKGTNAVDFYYPDLNLIIEVQGEQHYRPVGFGEKDQRVVVDSYKRQTIRDKMLKNLCLQHEILLLEVHYNEINTRSDKELQDYLEKSILNLI
tara:strand:- start:2254 stop:2649 length:396 start_codon:yes stop_codon:yes gene_type:complete